MFKSKSIIFGICLIVLIFAAFGYRYYLNNFIDSNPTSVSQSLNQQPKSDRETSKSIEKPDSRTLRLSLNEVSSLNKFVKDDNPTPTTLNIRKFSKNEVYFCQPDNFDLSTIQYAKVKNESLTPMEFYEISNPTDPDKTVFQLDGWIKEGEDKIVLSQSYELTQYKFGCSSQFDSVISLKKDGKIIKNFNYVISVVNQKAVSEDKKYLFIENYEPDGNDFIFKTRIYDIENDKMIDIPQIECVLSQNVFWNGNQLISTEEVQKAKKICIWDQSGMLKYQLEYPLATSTGSKTTVAASVGIYGDYLSVYNLHTPLYKAYDSCFVSVYNLKTGSSKEGMVIKANESGGCAPIIIKAINEDEMQFNFIDNNK